MKRQLHFSPVNKISWSMVEGGISLYVGVSMSYMLFFLTQAHHIPVVAAGSAMLAGRMSDILLYPIVGAVSDRTRSRWGRRRPFVLVGSISSGAAVAGLFAMPAHLTQSSKLIYFTIAYIVLNACLTLLVVPYFAMVPELARGYDARTELTGYRMIAARVGILTTVLAGPWIFQSRADLVAGFQLLGLCLGAVIITTGVICFIATRHAPTIEVPAARRGLRHEITSLWCNVPLRALIGIFAAQNIAIGAAATSLIYFLLYVVQCDARTAAILASSSLAATPLWIWITRRIEKRTAFCLGIFISLAALLGLGVSANLTLSGAIVLLIALGVGDSCCQLAPNSMVADTVEVTQAQTGDRREGAVSAAWVLTMKLGMTLGGFLAALLLDRLKVPALVQGIEPAAEQINGIKIAYALVPAVFWSCALLLLPTYRLGRVRFKGLEAALHNVAST